MSSKQTGSVKFFNEAKGFGFIKPDHQGRDIFVHASAVRDSNIDFLREGDRVEFDTKPDRKPEKGPQAVNLRVLA